LAAEERQSGVGKSTGAGTGSTGQPIVETHGQTGSGKTVRHLIVFTSNSTCFWSINWTV